MGGTTLYPIIHWYSPNCHGTSSVSRGRRRLRCATTSARGRDTSLATKRPGGSTKSEGFSWDFTTKQGNLPSENGDFIVIQVFLWWLYGDSMMILWWFHGGFTQWKIKHGDWMVIWRTYRDLRWMKWIKHLLGNPAQSLCITMGHW